MLCGPVGGAALGRSPVVGRNRPRRPGVGPAPGEYTALGAARQAAWAATGTLPDWELPVVEEVPVADVGGVRAAYAEARDDALRLAGRL